MQQQETKIEIGSVIKENSTGLFGIVFLIDDDGDYRVFDTDGDKNYFLKDDITPYSIGELLKNEKLTIIPNLSENYGAVLDFNKKVLRVGCQTIEFEKIKKIAAMLK